MLPIEARQVKYRLARYEGKRMGGRSPNRDKSQRLREGELFPGEYRERSHARPAGTEERLESTILERGGTPQSGI
jgi:hypothetical protein